MAALDAKDIRRSMPRFAADNNRVNLELLGAYAALANEARCSMAQLALAWVLGRGSHVVVIPGTTRGAHLEENLGADRVQLSGDLARRLEALINRRTVVGDRYNAATQAEIDTEEFV